MPNNLPPKGSSWPPPKSMRVYTMYIHLHERRLISSLSSPLQPLSEPNLKIVSSLKLSPYPPHSQGVPAALPQLFSSCFGSSPASPPFTRVGQSVARLPSPSFEQSQAPPSNMPRKHGYPPTIPETISINPYNPTAKPSDRRGTRWRIHCPNLTVRPM